MEVFAITAIGSFVVVLIVIVTLLKVKTPLYRLQRENVVQLLEMVITGQASANDWSVFTGIPIRHNPRLEEVRQRCLVIEAQEYNSEAHFPYLFSSKGITQLRAILEELKVPQ